MIVSRVLKAALFLSAASLSGMASASTPILFTPMELAALTALIKPEQTLLRIDGKTGVLTPAPAMEYLGLRKQEFEVKIDGAGNLAGLRFNNLQAKGLTAQFDGPRLKIKVPLVDQEKAIRSTLGAIHLRGVSLNIWTRVRETLTGSVIITLDQVELQGELKGTGLLAGASVIQQVRTSVVSAVKKQVTTILENPKTADAIEKSFVTWAQFSASKTLLRVVAGSVKVTPTGVEYQAE